jgi:hypothetical protein
VFVDPFSMQYLGGMTVDHVTSMQGRAYVQEPQCNRWLRLRQFLLRVSRKSNCGGGSAALTS